MPRSSFRSKDIGIIPNFRDTLLSLKTLDYAYKKTGNFLLRQCVNEVAGNAMRSRGEEILKYGSSRKRVNNTTLTTNISGSGNPGDE